MTIELRCNYLPEGGFFADVKQHYDTGINLTVFRKLYQDLQVDLLTDLPMEAASAFLYGEPGDIKRACETNARVARAHQRKYERTGF